MTDHPSATFLDLVAGRRGHFRLESGHHGTLWLDLDALFVDIERIAPLVALLTEAIRPHAVEAVCGPLVGGAFLAQLVARALQVDFGFTERVAAPEGAGLFAVRYRLPLALGSRLHGKRTAIVDDVMSAGSALRGTWGALAEAGAVPVVAGALLVLGSTGYEFFESQGVPVVAAGREPYPLWVPAECPLCRDGVPLEDPVS